MVTGKEYHWFLKAVEMMEKEERRATLETRKPMEIGDHRYQEGVSTGIQFCLRLVRETLKTLNE